MSSAIIVSSKERWIDFLPNTPISESDPKWGLTVSRLYYPSNQDPSIKEIVGKIRNSISHTVFTVKVGKDGTPWNVLMRETTYTFRDSKGKKPFERARARQQVGGLVGVPRRTSIIYELLIEDCTKTTKYLHGSSDQVKSPHVEVNVSLVHLRHLRARRAFTIS
jgi:hypothetical protein